MSVWIRLMMAVAPVVKRLIRMWLSTKMVAICVLLSKLCMSSWIADSSSTLLCSSALTVCSSSFNDCSSSLEDSSSQNGKDLVQPVPLVAGGGLFFECVLGVRKILAEPLGHLFRGHDDIRHTAVGCTVGHAVVTVESSD
jgi:hypothetical protein